MVARHRIIFRSRQNSAGPNKNPIDFHWKRLQARTLTQGTMGRSIKNLLSAIILAHDSDKIRSDKIFGNCDPPRLVYPHELAIIGHK